MRSQIDPTDRCTKCKTIPASRQESFIFNHKCGAPFEFFSVVGKWEKYTN